MSNAPTHYPDTSATASAAASVTASANTTPSGSSGRRRFRAYMALTRLDRPIGIWLLMWPMLWALWFAAGGIPSIKVLIIFVLGTILTRSAGCAINDYADRNFDAHVARTSNRPLATGEIKPYEALVIAALLMLLAFALVLQTNTLTIRLSVVALVLAAIYPFAKRYTHLPQVVLGLAFSWAIPMAYAAQTNQLERITWLVFIASVLWAVAYDTEYSMADRDDDRKIGIKSTAILFGDTDIFMIGLIQFLVIMTMTLAGRLLELGFIYYAGLVIAACMVVYQLILIRKRQPKLCIRAFLNNHYLGMVIFIAIVLDYLFSHPGLSLLAVQLENSASLPLCSLPFEQALLPCMTPSYVNGA